MKYIFVLLTTTLFFGCSPKISPDAGWGYQRWVLTEMKGVPVQQSGGRRDAFISFTITEKRFSGNAGCNQMNGNYSLDKNDIRFTEVITTKMSCDDIEFENTFLATLAEVTGYEVDGTNLKLKKRRTTVLVLTSRQVR
ncbi:MAG TPA: META domain-containing protein [Chitinophagaceae bacterium]